MSRSGLLPGSHSYYEQGLDHADTRRHNIQQAIVLRYACHHCM
jgi:hypothetical protein